jgi:hypothetical protein
MALAHLQTGIFLCNMENHGAVKSKKNINMEVSP